MENPIKMDDLGVPLFVETPTYRDYHKPLWKWHHENMYQVIKSSGRNYHVEGVFGNPI